MPHEKQEQRSSQICGIVMFGTTFIRQK